MNDGFARSWSGFPCHITVTDDDVEALVEMFGEVAEHCRSIKFVGNDAVTVTHDIPSHYILRLENVKEVANADGRVPNYIDVVVDVQKVADALYQMQEKGEGDQHVQISEILFNSAIKGYDACFDSSQVDAVGASAIIDMIAYGEIVFG
jgi:tryptophanase